MAVAVILAALLRRAEQGPGAGRVLARTLSAREMTNHLPPDLTAAAVAEQPPAAASDAVLPTAGRRAALPAPPEDDPEPDDEPGSAVAEVVPFGIFDPFADDLEARR